jgi:hypothetical protein
MICYARRIFSVSIYENKPIETGLFELQNGKALSHRFQRNRLVQIDETLIASVPGFDPFCERNGLFSIFGSAEARAKVKASVFLQNLRRFDNKITAMVEFHNIHMLPQNTKHTKSKHMSNFDKLAIFVKRAIG